MGSGVAVDDEPDLAALVGEVLAEGSSPGVPTCGNQGDACSLEGEARCGSKQNRNGLLLGDPFDTHEAPLVQRDAVAEPHGGGDVHEIPINSTVIASQRGA